VFKGTALALTGAYRDIHYRSFYFHASGAKAKAAYKHYLDSISNAVGKFREERGVFPVLIGAIGCPCLQPDLRAVKWSAGIHL
jgi:hypothetical protein